MGRTVDYPTREYDLATNGISLHVTEQGVGPVLLFCHGFADTAYTWRRQMAAVAAAGYRAIAPDMRGYGGSSAPADANLYTPFHTAGDLVGLMDALSMWGKADGLRELYPLTVDQMRSGLPGLVGGLELDNVGHWIHHESPNIVNETLLILRTALKAGS